MKQFFLFSIAILFWSCSDQKLPYLGEPELIDGKKVYPKIATFAFLDQDSVLINDTYLKDKIHVAGFIFLSCPTICPKMTNRMSEVYKDIKNKNNIVLLSFTIDPKRDGIPQLKAYSENLGVESSKWHFLTGNQDSIIHLANNSYFATAYPDSTAPGGFTHSGGLLLIDKDRFLRGVYDGTSEVDTRRLLNDIKILEKENE